MLHEYKGKWPKLGERVYVAEGAQIVGDVEIGDHSSIWYNCVVRGDVHYIRIGKHTNIARRNHWPCHEGRISADPSAITSVSVTALDVATGVSSSRIV